jgi:hypothetical protein
MPAMAFRPATTRSRRARNSRTIASTSSWGPVSASTAASCECDEVHDTELMISRENGASRGSGTIA